MILGYKHNMPIRQKIKNITTIAVTACGILASFSFSHISSATGFDVITMKNGDIHNGTAALERFTIKTSYGGVSIPYISMEKLTLGGIYGRDEIRTRMGELFSGKITDSEVMALRDSGPILPLDIADIAVIEFSPRQKIPANIPPSDAIETHSGDRFTGWILTKDYLLKSATSMQILDREKIRIIDIDSDRDQKVTSVQLTSGNGERFQGELLLQNIGVKTRYGETLDISLSQLSTLTFGSNGMTSKQNFHYRRNLDPSALIRDRMADGIPGPELIILQGGKFQRGDLQGDGDGDERPPINIKLKPFAIGIYEITFDEYDLFCADSGRDMPDDEGWGRGRRPVINVSWEDASAYTLWLSRKTGHSYRLPSDAEWEYAARAGTKTRFWWGQEVEKHRANCEGCGSIWDGEKSAPVGRFPPNRFGLHDSAGNLFEWVADCLHDDFSQDPSDGSPVDRPDCGKRIIRGGAWSFPPKEIRSANRWRDFPTRRSDDTGFRVVRELK